MLIPSPFLLWNTTWPRNHGMNIVPQRIETHIWNQKKGMYGSQNWGLIMEWNSEPKRLRRRHIKKNGSTWLLLKGLQLWLWLDGHGIPVNSKVFPANGYRKIHGFIRIIIMKWPYLRGYIYIYIHYIVYTPYFQTDPNHICNSLTRRKTCSKFPGIRWSKQIRPQQATIRMLTNLGKLEYFTNLN